MWSWDLRMTAWRGPPAIGTITAGVQLEDKITGCDSQAACRQDELIGGKLPVV
jgi:hypothetical protein